MDRDFATDIASALRRASLQAEPADAEILLAHALQRDRAWLIAHAGDALPEAARRRFEALLARRAQGEPVAYLRGTQGFWTLQLTVTPDTLIPRPETELLVELALARLTHEGPLRVADLGTGSGAIALAIAKERPAIAVVATDLSGEALAVARGNARAQAIANVEFRQGSWFVPLAGERFDLIASNPPYIADGDPHLQQGDLRHEPAAALSSGAEGLSAIREIVLNASAHLRSGGWLLIEHGWRQGQAVRELFLRAGMEAVRTGRDLEDRERVTLGGWRG